jgi:hypothetical protein
LNGDGRSDVFVYNASDGRWVRCISQPDDNFSYTNAGIWSPGWTIYPADFNGDARADLFLYNATADANHGRTFRVLSNADESLTYLEGEMRWSSDWTIIPGDYDGDGRTDLFLYRASGDWYRVTFAPTGTVYDSGRWSAGWTIQKGYFNTDRRADLLAYDPATGRAVVILSEANGGFTYVEHQWPPHVVVALTDFNDDNQSDVLLYDAASGQWTNYMTTLPGQFAAPVTGTFGAGWTLIATRTIVP